MTGKKHTTEQLIVLYKNIMEFLKDADITFILFYGSLLGYHRDGCFIENDDDIDVLIDRANFDKLRLYIQNNIEKYPNISSNNNTYYYILQLWFGDLGPFDIYPFEDHSSEHILIRWDGDLLYKKSEIYPINIVNIYGYNIGIPHNTEALMLETYGSNWKIPQTKHIDYEWDNITTVKRLT
jgi:hypothetical protein